MASTIQEKSINSAISKGAAHAVYKGNYFVNIVYEGAANIIYCKETGTVCTFILVICIRYHIFKVNIEFMKKVISFIQIS